MEKTRVRISKKGVIINLNKAFYSSDAIRQAVNDFNEVCSAKVNRQNIMLVPKDTKIQPSILGYEFCNYILGLMNDRL